MAKKTTKKAATPKEGIFLFKNSKGLGARLKENGEVLCTIQGYNTKAGVNKGIRAIRALIEKHTTTNDWNDPRKDTFTFVDLTKKK